MIPKSVFNLRMTVEIASAQPILWIKVATASASRKSTSSYQQKLPMAAAELSAETGTDCQDRACNCKSSLPSQQEGKRQRIKKKESLKTSSGAVTNVKTNVSSADRGSLACLSKGVRKGLLRCGTLPPSL